MSRLGEALERIDRVMSERRSPSAKPEVTEAATHYRRFLSLAGAERGLERERVVNHLASGVTRRKP